LAPEVWVFGLMALKTGLCWLFPILLSIPSKFIPALAPIFALRELSNYYKGVYALETVQSTNLSNSCFLLDTNYKQFSTNVSL
jgi:hypothetical protein